MYFEIFHFARIKCENYIHLLNMIGKWILLHIGLYHLEEKSLCVQKVLDFMLESVAIVNRMPHFIHVVIALFDGS